MSNNPFTALIEAEKSQPSNISVGATPYASPFEGSSPTSTRSNYFADLTPLSKALHDRTTLTPLRAHYLKRELISLQVLDELKHLSQPDALAILGPPFGPAAAADQRGSRRAQDIDLPFVRFIFHHFVLSFPLLAKTSPAFYKDKLQPFVHSFLNRNISTSDDRGTETKRHAFAGKIDKHLGLVIAAAVKLTDNDGQEAVVRVTEKDIGASQPGGAATGLANRANLLVPGTAKSDAFEVNIVTVRSIVVKGRLKNSMREEFIIRSRFSRPSSGQTQSEETYVSRRYRDFYELSSSVSLLLYLDELTDKLRKEFPEEDVRPPPAKDRKTTEARAANISTSSSSHSLQGSFGEDSYDSETMAEGTPLTLARERNRLTLRAYLRQLLASPAVASSTTMRGFLTDEPTILSATEKADVRAREEMDRSREEEQLRFRQEVTARVTELETHLRAFKEELIKKDGLTRVFSTIRTTPNVDDLPVRYRRLIEWARISLASTIYQMFAGSDNSSANFYQLKKINGLMPYFVLKGILRISNPVAMIRAFLDLFLARPFGQASLIQRMFSSGLTDEIREAKEDMALVAQKINDERLVKKVAAFVYSSRDVQEVYQAEADADNIDIIAVILRTPTDIPLEGRAMAQIARSNSAYQQYRIKRASMRPEDDQGPDNDDAWLFEDLNVYMRLCRRARDKEQLIELIFEGGTSELLKDIVTIFYRPLAQVYRAANIAESIGDLQAFINDLIKTVDAAEQASASSPQKTVQIFADLVARHENSFYQFVHNVHNKGQGLFDDLMKWIELFVNLVRDGFPEKVSLDYLLPHAGKEREQVIAEVDAVIAYHRQLKVAHYQRMRRRLNRGEQSDRDEDAAFVAGVMQNLNMGSVGDDVTDLQAEDSEEEEQADLSDSESFVDASENLPAATANSVPTFKPRSSAFVAPPVLVHLPKLVPVLVELIRPSLIQARQQARQAGL